MAKGISPSSAANATEKADRLTRQAAIKAAAARLNNPFIYLSPHFKLFHASWTDDPLSW